MSNLIFKEDNYTYKELLQFYLSGKKYYSEGDVYDTNDGEICDIKELKVSMSDKYINELLKPYEQVKINKNYEKEVLYNKYKNNSINKEDMYRLLTILGQNRITPNYNYDKGYIILNANMLPEKISDSDYGKFNKLLNFLHTNHNNRLSYNNGKTLKKIDIAEFLKYKSVKNLNEYLRKMKKIRLLDEMSFGGIKYLIINPAYAITSDFTLEQYHIDLFGEEVFKLYYFTTKDIQVIEKYKHLLSDLEYKKMSFKLNPSENYIVFNEDVIGYGIYLLYDNENVVYIGKSNNMKNRINQHKKDKEFNSVKCIIFKDEGLVNLYEPYLIQKYKPKYNKDLLEDIKFELPAIEL
jgi:hypothetical protein